MKERLQSIAAALAGRVEVEPTDDGVRLTIAGDAGPVELDVPVHRLTELAQAGRYEDCVRELGVDPKQLGVAGTALRFLPPLATELALLDRASRVTLRTHLIKLRDEAVRAAVELDRGEVDVEPLCLAWDAVDELLVKHGLVIDELDELDDAQS